MDITTLVNGQSSPALDGRDRGLAYGDGVFETIALKQGQVQLLPSHRQRLATGLLALSIVADETATLTITGNGDVLEPENGVISVGSGGNFALAAAKALFENTELSAKDIVERGLTIAGDICVFTNHNFTIETLSINVDKK